MIAGSEIETARFLVPKKFNLLLGQLICLDEPFLFTRGLKQSNEPVDQKGIVIEVGIKLGPLQSVGTKQSSFFGFKVGKNENCCTLSGLNILFVF